MYTNLYDYRAIKDYPKKYIIQDTPSFVFSATIRGIYNIFGLDLLHIYIE